MNQSKKLLIDKRTTEDILEDINSKAKGYTPEWHIDSQNPDIGYAISKVFANQMEENIDRLNQILDNYHVEFVNMLDISPKSARPAEGLVEFVMGTDTVPGTYVPKGTKLRSDAEEPIIYETQQSVYVTGSNLSNIFMVDGEDGVIKPIKGKFDVPNLIPSPQTEEAPEEDLVYRMKPFRLFGEDDSVAKNAIYFYLDSVVDTGDSPVFMKLDANKDLLELIEDKKICFSWYTKNGLVEFESVQLLEDRVTVELLRDSINEIATLPIDGKNYNLIVLESTTPVANNYSVKSVLFSSKGYPEPLDFATDGNLDFDAKNFDPFGEELAPFDQCFIGMNRYFNKSGAKVEMTFDVSYHEHLYGAMGMGPDGTDELKVIKRKPKIRPSDIPADCTVSEISLEYFNGTGWKKLETDEPVFDMFSRVNAGSYHISFKVPYDWEESDAGAYRGRVLKLQIIQAENSYARPCIHHYPKIKNCRVTYSYEERYIAPQKVKSIVGTKVYDLSKQVYEGKPYNLLATTEYFNDALYLGFSRPFENGPISIMFDIKEDFGQKALRYVFEYSGINGFKPMRVLDTTGGMTRTGTVTFLPLPDMMSTEIEGQNRYWIRIIRNKTMVEENKKTLPVINDIKLNVIRVANIDRLEEREIYIDSVKSNQVINLHEQDILDVDLWVNELGFISAYELEKEKTMRPDSVKIEYDAAGNMTSCFIRYEECNTFQLAEHKRVYVLDRINGEVIFGDGIKTAIPRVLNDVAVKIRISLSQGSRGNAEAGTISGSMGNILFINEIKNPLKIYNGSDMENIENVLKRGSLLLQARNRLLSTEDFKREIALYTDTVKDIEVICEVLKDGSSDPLAVSCVLLLKDSGINCGDFHHIGEGIKQHLLDNCEITINKNSLHIVDPIFVDISVDIWVESVDLDESFELQNMLKKDLEEYLNPTNGWKIGTLPKPSQIMMRMNVLKSKAVIRKSIIIAKYTDHEGEHEMDIKNVKITPYMICRSGNHNVHMIMSN